MTIRNEPKGKVLGINNTFVNDCINKQNEIGSIMGNSCEVKYVDFGVQINLYDTVQVEKLDNHKTTMKIVDFE